MDQSTLDRAYGTAESLVAESADLISLPEICLSLKNVLDDPDHDREDVVDVIACDPGLCARLLHIVNSAYYGFPRQIADISQALSIIGEHELRNLVLVTSVVSALKGAAGKHFDLERFWNDSLVRGILARKIAAICQPLVKEQLFIAGLLQDIGQLILFHKHPDLYLEVVEVRQSAHVPQHEAERELLGFDHASVGGVMATSWNFPAILVSIIAHHHDCASTDHQTECGQVQLADHLANMEDTADQPTTIAAFEKLNGWQWAKEKGLGDTDLPKLRKLGMEQFHAVREVFFGGN